MGLCWGCFDNSPQYDSPSSDTGAIHLMSLTATCLRLTRLRLCCTTLWHCCRSPGPSGPIKDIDDADSLLETDHTPAVLGQADGGARDLAFACLAAKLGGDLVNHR